VRAHFSGHDDGLVRVGPLLERWDGRFADHIDEAPPPDAISALRASETIGRLLGSPAFLDALAARTSRDPRPRKRGPRGSQKGVE
jgi:putative transposase